MKKYIVLMFMLSACGSFPTASEYWTINGKWPGYTVVQDEMKACGFINTWNPVDMPDDEYVKAHLCMEQKGYLTNNRYANGLVMRITDCVSTENSN